MSSSGDYYDLISVLTFVLFTASFYALWIFSMVLEILASWIFVFKRSTPSMFTKCIMVHIFDFNYRVIPISNTSSDYVNCYFSEKRRSVGDRLVLKGGIGELLILSAGCGLAGVIYPIALSNYLFAEIMGDLIFILLLIRGSRLMLHNHMER